MSKKSTQPGTAGNARHPGIPLRDWSRGSYNPTTGRSHSSVAEYHGPAPLHGNYAGECHPQLPTPWARDKRATQDPTPVRERKFTRTVE